MQNIEYKCELRDLIAARAKCRELGAARIGLYQQTDTYFRIPDGRLKKREVPDEPTEWIFYHRPDRISPCMSNFTIYSDTEAKTRWGLANFSPWVIVKKQRELFLLRNIRIHLDQVEDLGSFLEFEAQVSRNVDVKKCHEAVKELRNQFAPITAESISGSYSDLLDRQLREAEL